MGRPKKVFFTPDCYVKFLREKDLSLEQFALCSPKPTQSFLADFCCSIGLKNTLNNRMMIYIRLKREYSEVHKLFLCTRHQQNLSNIAEPSAIVSQFPGSSKFVLSEKQGIPEIPILTNIEHPSKLENIDFSNNVLEQAMTTCTIIPEHDQIKSYHIKSSVKLAHKFELLLSFDLNRYVGDRDISEHAEFRHSGISKNTALNGITCVIIFKGSRINKRRNPHNSVIIEYAMCKQPNCRKYKFVVILKNNYVTVDVHFKGPTEVDHTEEYSYWLKGPERHMMMEKLKCVTPNVARMEDIKKINSELFLDGNWQTLRSLSVYQKVRSQALAEGDTHKDSLQDLLLRSIQQQDNELRYIQVPNGMTIVYLFSKQQIRVLVGKGERVTAFFDATGSVVRPHSYDHNHRILYYSLVVNKNGRTVPIAELISAKHDSATLMSFLFNFRHFVETKCLKKWPIFKVVVTDWSFALITSLCKAFNDMTLYTYLKICYRYVTNCLSDFQLENIVILKFCCAHFVKMICSKLSTTKQKTELIKVIVDSVAVLAQCSSLEELAFQFENVVVILIKPKYDRDVAKALEELSSESYDTSDEFLKGREDYNNYFVGIEDDEYEPVRGTYITSPFFTFFYEIFNKVSQQASTLENVSSDDKPNPFKHEMFCQYLLKRIMPFVPLWSDLLCLGRYSNATVESWFKTLKKEILDGRTNNKVGRFVNKTNERINTELKAINLKIGLAPRRKNLKRIRELTKEEIDDPKKEEEWSKRRKNQGFGFFQQRYLKCFVSGNQNINRNEGGNKIPTQAGAIIDHESNDDIITIDEKNQFETTTIEKLNSVAEEAIASEKVETVSQEFQTDYPDQRALENGLFYDNEYYITAAQNEDFYFGTFTLGCYSINIHSSDYATLISKYNIQTHFTKNRGRWLTDYCIDAAAIALLRNVSHIYYIDTISTHILLNDQQPNSLKFAPYVQVLDNVRYILLPYNHVQTHWALIVLDKEKKIFIY